MATADQRLGVADSRRGPLSSGAVSALAGRDYKTVNSYADYLEGAFLLQRLPPYLPNLSKRLTKTPKVYWRDSGLVHAMLGVRSFDHLLTQPCAGASWEGFVINQTIAALTAAGKRFRTHMFRTSDRYKLDFVLEVGGDLWAGEVKLSSSPGPEAVRRLQRTAAMIGASSAVLVCRIAEPVEGSGLLITTLADWLARLTCL